MADGKLNEAQRRLAGDNTRLVGKVLGQYFPAVRPGTELSEEAWAEGRYVLCRAALAYRPEKGIKFSTYACTCLSNHFSRWLPWALKRGLRGTSRVVFPSNLEDGAWDGVAGREEVGGGDPFGLGDLEPLVRALPPRHQLAIRLAYQADEPGHEAGRRLGVCRAWANQTRVEAEAMLREALGETV